MLVKIKMTKYCVLINNNNGSIFGKKPHDCPSPKQSVPCSFACLAILISPEEDSILSFVVCATLWHFRQRKDKFVFLEIFKDLLRNLSCRTPYWLGKIFVWFWAFQRSFHNADNDREKNTRKMSLYLHRTHVSVSPLFGHFLHSHLEILISAFANVKSFPFPSSFLPKFITMPLNDPCLPWLAAW